MWVELSSSTIWRTRAPEDMAYTSKLTFRDPLCRPKALRLTSIEALGRSARCILTPLLLMCIMSRLMIS